MDLISGTPVLDIKPYIPEYDSPLTHTPLTSEPQDRQEIHPDVPDTLEEVEPAELERLENLVSSSVLKAEEQLGDVSGVLEELKEVLLQLAEDKHTDTPAAAHEDEGEDKVCESNSSVASWIRKPLVRRLSVRFTPTAERQLAHFLPPHCSGLTPATPVTNITPPIIINTTTRTAVYYSL